MGRSFNAAIFPSGTAPNTRVFKPAAAQVFKAKALVVLNSAGLLTECAADPSIVLGVSGAGAFQGPGQNVQDSTQTTGLSTKNSGVPVMVADRNTIFSCRAINGGTDPVTPLATHIDEKYGVAKVGNDWVMDMAETTALVVEVVDYDADQKIFFVKFLEAVLNLS